MKECNKQNKYVLAFDTANEAIVVGVGMLYAVDRSVVCVAEEKVAAHRASNTKLLSIVNGLMKRAGVFRGDIECVVVGRGPGSFTGVRIAMATAKGAAQALGVGLIGVSSLDAVAWHAQASGVRGTVLVVADAMRKEVYPVRFRLDEAGAHRLEGNSVVKADVCAERYARKAASVARTSWRTSQEQGEHLLIAGDALVKYAELFEPCGQLLPSNLWTPTGTGLLLALQSAWQLGEADPADTRRHNPAFVLPVYTRLSDAEENERVRLAKRDTSLAESRDSKHITMNDTAISNARANSAGIAYKPLDAAHTAHVAALEARIMGTDAWTESLVADELGRADRVWWAAYAADPSAPLPADAPLVGYAGGWVVDGDVQILKVGVDPAFRRRGIATELIARVVSDARNLGAHTSSLEVRVGNAFAQALYRSLGYESLGTRPRYYSDGEDAVIMKASELPCATGDVAGMDILVAPTCRAFDNGCSGSPAGTTTSNEVDASGVTDALSGEDASSGSETPNGTETPRGTDVSSAGGARPRVMRPLIFAIESSCDETAAAIVDGNGTLIADVVASQVDFHARFGGVVPEIASRKHIEAICGVCDECFDVASRNMGLPDGSLAWNNMDAVSVTYAPGLLGALVVGVAFAKGAAWAADLPFIGVNHLEGHLYANKIDAPDFAPPAVVSLVSGGNTMLVYMKGWGDYQVLGETIDDAVGEAFDKVAKALGLGYPGGPVVSKQAAAGDAAAIAFPRAMMHSGDLRFSLSGLKTAVVTYINAEREAGRALNVPDICASFQQAVVDVQVKKAQAALEQTGAPTFCLGGGVAANPVLRRAYERMCERMGVRLVMPPLSSCGDNAGMIALVALDRFRAGKFFDLTADALAHVNLEEPY